MKKTMVLTLLVFIFRSFLSSNPVDGIPFVRFSELVFDDADKWTMEIIVPDQFGAGIDSVVIAVSNQEARLKGLRPGFMIAVVTSDSLTAPLTIHRDGDKIVIRTFAGDPTDSTMSLVTDDSIRFGNFPGATVGRPVSGYSIMRNSWRYSSNSIGVDCLTRHPSLGALNDTVGLSATLRGFIYDSHNRPVTKLKVFPAAPCYFILETPLSVDSNGAYTTTIFPTICRRTTLAVRLEEFFGWIDSVSIEPFELNDIQPDTAVVKDIHLKDDNYVVTSAKNSFPDRSDQLTFANYPNPFNLSTTFLVKRPASMRTKPASILIFNAGGQFVKSIPVKEGVDSIWDGRDGGGRVVPSGVYYYRLTLGGEVVRTGSTILLK